MRPGKVDSLYPSTTHIYCNYPSHLNFHYCTLNVPRPLYCMWSLNTLELEFVSFFCLLTDTLCCKLNLGSNNFSNRNGLASRKCSLTNNQSNNSFTVKPANFGSKFLWNSWLATCTMEIYTLFSMCISHDHIMLDAICLFCTDTHLVWCLKINVIWVYQWPKLPDTLCLRTKKCLQLTSTHYTHCEMAVMQYCKKEGTRRKEKVRSCF